MPIFSALQILYSYKKRFECNNKNFCLGSLCIKYFFFVPFFSICQLFYCNATFLFLLVNMTRKIKISYSASILRMTFFGCMQHQRIIKILSCHDRVSHVGVGVATYSQCIVADCPLTLDWLCLCECAGGKTNWLIAAV